MSTLKALKAQKNKSLDALGKDYQKLDDSDLPGWKKRQIKAAYFGRLLRMQYED